jgi:uncharacterized protein (DUF1778 family)
VRDGGGADAELVCRTSTEHPAASPSIRSTLSESALDILGPYCHCEYMSSLKADRLQIRVDPADKALLERAAAAAHVNLSAFVVQAAAARAEEVLAERPSIRLSPEAAAAFSQALEQPGRVNERLAQALRRRRKFEWID